VCTYFAYESPRLGGAERITCNSKMGFDERTAYRLQHCVYLKSWWTHAFCTRGFTQKGLVGQ